MRDGTTGGIGIKLSFTPLIIALLAIIFISGLTACASSSDDESYSGASPLYEYRYAQAAEGIGILDSGATESRLAYSSISTSSLNPEDDCQGGKCQPTVKDAGETSSASCGLNSCVGSSTCGYSGATCYSTCSGTCSGCSQTYGGTCSRSCSGTCSDTCGSNTCGSSTCKETCSSSCGLASCGGLTACGGDFTCGPTCSNSCGGTCAYTCSSSCYSTCISSCSGTCSNSCGNTCASTCMNTCTGTCSVTCGSTCSNTCGNTCASTCSATCSSTCSNTCASTCASNCIKTTVSTGAGTSSNAGEAASPSNASQAKSAALSPPAAEQNSLMAYDVLANPPSSVYYKGVNMPWSAFNQSFSGKDLLAWIEMNDGAWATAAQASKGTWIRQLVYVPAGGDLVLSRNAPKGASNRDFGQTTPGYKYVWFYADLPGTYTGIFNLGGLQSNSIAISLN